MKCIDETYAQLYFDGELNPEQNSIVETHLAHCAQCAGLVDKQRVQANNLKSILNSLSAEKIVIPEFPFKTEQHVVKGRKKSIYYSIAAIAVVILLMLNLFPLQKSNQDQISYVQFMPEEIDANSPITDQELDIVVTDPSGNREHLVIY